MTNLQLLYDELSSLLGVEKSFKVSFYYPANDGVKLLSGYFLVHQGAECFVHFEQLPTDDALEKIAKLKFLKVMSVPMVTIDRAREQFPATSLKQVLNQLHPSRHQASALAIETAAKPVAAVAPPKVERIQYSSEDMLVDAIQLLQPIFGNGANARAQECVAAAPPDSEPAEFLGRCRQQASMMVGLQAAETLFQPLFERLRLATESNGPNPNAANKNDAAAKPKAFYSHLALKSDAIKLLEPFYGVGTEAKVMALAKAHPPEMDPGGFVRKCIDLAAVMVGKQKAEVLFQSVVEKLQR